MEMGWTSLRVVLDKILRDPIMNGLTYEHAVDYFIDFINLVGVPSLFENKIATKIPVVNYRAELPVDYVEQIQVSLDEKLIPESSDTHIQFLSDIKSLTSQYFEENMVDFTYRIADGYIYLSKETGSLNIVYRAIKLNTDETSQDYGTPMMPDDPVFILALQAYIEAQFLKILWRNDKVSDKVYNQSQQDYAFKVAQYETHARRITLGQMENISRMFRSIQLKRNEFATRFKNVGLR